MPIENDEEFAVWLGQQPAEVRIAISVRAALRILPALFSIAPQGDREEMRAILACRAILSASVATKFQDIAVQGAVSVSSSVVASLADEIDGEHYTARGVAAHTAASAAIAAKNIQENVSSVETTLRTVGLSSDATDSNGEADFASYADAGLEPNAIAMFTVPINTTPAFNDAFKRMQASDKIECGTQESRSFWSRWYEHAMAGDPLPWDLQREVALIPDEIWQQGPEAVAEEIEKIEADYLARTTQLAEEVTLDPETGTFSVTPLPLENAPLIAALLARTEDALEDALLGPNGLREDMRAVRTLRRSHQKYGNDPQRIELDYTSVAITLRREIRETHELAETEDNLALLEAVEEGALAIRAQHPDIAANRQRIAQQKLREMDPADLEVLEAVEPVLVTLSEGVMADDFARDIPQLINDATTPLPSGAPPLPGMDESMRIFHRVSGMRVLMDKLVDKGASLFDSKTNKAIRLALQGVGGLGLAASGLDLIWRVIEIGLKVFGVL